MTKQINVRFNENEADLQEWAQKQTSVSGSVKLLIRQAIARYGPNIDVQDALIKESIHYGSSVLTDNSSQKANIQ